MCSSSRTRLFRQALLCHPLYHFYIRLGTFQINMDTLLSKLFEIKLSILQFETSIFHFRIDFSETVVISFQERFGMAFFEIFGATASIDTHC